MRTKSFLGYAKPTFRYEALSAAMPQPVSLAIPSSITLLLEQEMGREPSETIKVGAEVKTGQKLTWNGACGPTVISSVTGEIKALAPQIGDYGRQYTAITVAATTEDEWDGQFASIAAQPTVQHLVDFFSSAPGGPDLAKLADPDKPVKTIAIYGGDTDLLVETNLYVLKRHTADVNQGIQVLKQVTGIENVVLAVPGESVQHFDGHFKADVRSIPDVYPGGQPLMMMHQLFGKLPNQGQSCEDLGIFFIRTEAVAAIGKAFRESRVPVEKILTIVDKQGKRYLASMRIGTPISAVLQRFNIIVNDRDRLICGGPMTGSAIYDENQPIMPHTDAILVQDQRDILLSSDSACINCGECIRTCPAMVPVNLLVRFLEAGQYQEGADLYDLYSCVECGLCNYVCVARIPILQYVKLAKYELARAIEAEEENA